MNTFAETEMLLKTAITLSENSVKQIAAAAGIKPNTLYKWRTTSVHLSPAKMDALTRYFIEQEPMAIVAAVALARILDLLYVYLASSSDEEVSQEEWNYGIL